MTATKTKTAKPQFEALNNVRVRFDSDAGEWATLNAQNNPERHFNKGLMRNITFSSVMVSRDMRGCGTHKYVGIAQGDLLVDTTVMPGGGFKNIEFRDQAFRVDGEPITKASALRLLPSRAALCRI